MRLVVLVGLLGLLGLVGCAKGASPLAQGDAPAGIDASRVDAFENFTDAPQTDAALADARPSGDNAFKIELARRVVVRALSLAAAGTPDRIPPLPASVFAPGVPAHV